jgi:hypothetical protein
VRWNDYAQSPNIVHDPGLRWQSVAFVFHNAERNVAFAVYFDEHAPIGIERVSIRGSTIEETPIPLWLSPLVPEPEPNDLPRPSYSVEDWWHSLSYGIDQHGAAYQRHPSLPFKQTDEEGETSV